MHTSQPSLAVIPVQAAFSDLDHAIDQLKDNLQILASRLDGALTPAECVKSMERAEDAVASSPIVLAIANHTERVRTLDLVVADLLRRLEI